MNLHSLFTVATDNMESTPSSRGTGRCARGGGRGRPDTAIRWGSNSMKFSDMFGLGSCKGCTSVPTSTVPSVVVVNSVTPTCMSEPATDVSEAGTAVSAANSSSVQRAKCVPRAVSAQVVNSIPPQSSLQPIPATRASLEPPAQTSTTSQSLSPPQPATTISASVNSSSISYTTNNTTVTLYVHAYNIHCVYAEVCVKRCVHVYVLLFIHVCD